MRLSKFKENFIKVLPLILREIIVIPSNNAIEKHLKERKEPLPIVIDMEIDKNGTIVRKKE